MCYTNHTRCSLIAICLIIELLAFNLARWHATLRVAMGTDEPLSVGTNEHAHWTPPAVARRSPVSPAEVHDDFRTLWVPAYQQISKKNNGDSVYVPNNKN